MPGTLYLVATPIGNLEDITLRALRILREVDLIACEDTRHSRKLTSHFGISTPLTACHQHNEEGKGEQLLRQLQAGKSIALISDAGTPAISDPGFVLVRLCRNAGIAVTAVPGPSATVAALSISGLPVERFAFDGFLPAKSHARREVFRRLLHEERTVLFYEAPHRLAAALADLVLELGAEREVAVARELTKLHEELFRGTAQAAREHFGREKVRGEIVLMIAPAPPAPPSAETVEEALERVAAETGLPMKGVVKLVAKAFGLPGDEVYKAALALKEGRGIKG
jgi:16S rRNA (cytidine1402-2'-O)-methyltransferase